MTDNRQGPETASRGLDAQKHTLMLQLAETLRAVLSERIVRAPTEELGAIGLPDSPAVARRKEQEDDDRPPIDPKRIIEARSRLLSGNTSRQQTGDKRH